MIDPAPTPTAAASATRPNALTPVPIYVLLSACNVLTDDDPAPPGRAPGSRTNPNAAAPDAAETSMR
ncbi:hypothetical protein Dsi01nite_026460 [Dactylosporangium siamense]|uniref:Uncharacterized protein n=1 Tax=Dactylosporangium siamense TaxID=685454 RepID=A0A919UAD4_9ACTN|nr:hypothetical protein Dsi01nite_026460 [Dactylosporangium siamense]